MRVIKANGAAIELGMLEALPTVGMIDYSRRITDDYGVTTVVKRGFARKMSVRLAVQFTDVDTIQNSLAELRATPARWEADTTLSWLNFQGFYKDFDIDLAVPPLSYCSLTVEGLAEVETGTDSGIDPSSSGSASTLLVIHPVAVTDSVLISSNVLENDYPVWAAATSYAIGARVIKAATHRIYESAKNNNVGNDPAGSGGLWFDVGPTNQRAMFDQALGTITQRAGNITLTLAPGTVSAISLIDIVGATIRIQMSGYDQTKSAATGMASFLDLPSNASNMTVTITGPGIVSVGTLIVGRLLTLGTTGEAPSAGITDYSRKETDAFGAVNVVQRAWSKRMNLQALIKTSALDLVANRIAKLRATPALWIADDGINALNIYGFFKEFSINVGENISTLSLSIEGLSKSTPLAGLPVADNPAVLIIAQKITLEATEASRESEYQSKILRMGPAQLSITTAAMTSARATWLAYRNAIAPAWNNTGQNSTIVRADYNAATQAYDAALDASDIAISQEDARRSVWDQTTGRPPLLTGDSVTADDTLLDPTVWANLSCTFLRDATGEGFVSSTASGNMVIYHKPENATPIDFTATYEASYELQEAGSGVATSLNYIVIVAYDNLGNNIAGDGTFWHCPYAGVLQSRGVWEKQCARFGQGTDFSFPPNAVKFGLGVLIDTSVTGVITSARRLKTRRIAKNNFTAVTPYKWTLGDDQLICNIGVSGWRNVAYSKSAIAGPQKFTARLAGSTYVILMMGLTESTAPTFYVAGAGQMFLEDSKLRIYEGAVLKAEYLSVPNVQTAEFAVEYDGLRLRYYVNGVALVYSTYVGPNKLYKAFVDAYYAGTGLVNVTHASSQGAAIIGGNTYSSSGTALSAQDLMNNVIGIVNGQFINPAGTGSGISVANSSIVLNADGTGSYFNGTSFVNIGAVSLTGLGAGALAFRDKTTYFSTTTPTSPTPQENEQWCNPTTREIRIYISGAWSLPMADLTGASQLTIAGVDDITINFDHANNAITSLPRSQEFKVTRGGVDVTATAALIVTVKSGTIAASITADGLLSVDKLGGVLTSAVLELGGAYGAAALPTKTVRITRENAAPPTAPPSSAAGNATSDSTSFNGVSNSITPAAVSRELVVVAGTTGTVTLSGSYIYTVATPPASTSSYGASIQWYKWTGSAYVAIGVPIAAYSTFFARSADPGEGDCGFSDTGNIAGSTQKYKLFAFRSNPTPNTGQRTLSGSVSATGVNP